MASPTSPIFFQQILEPFEEASKGENKARCYAIANFTFILFFP